MSTRKDFLTLAKAFGQIGQRCAGRLRADRQVGGWGRSEREYLANKASACSPQITEYLEAAAAAPHWWLRGGKEAEAVADEFRTFANRAAELVGASPADGWLSWLDQILTAGLGDDSGESVSDACAASAQYCALLATGFAPLLPANRIGSIEVGREPLGSEEREALASRIQTLTGEERQRLAHDRRRRVDAYLLKQQQKQIERPTRKQIWCKLRYKTPKDFEQWQRADPLSTLTATKAFEDFLTKHGV